MIKTWHYVALTGILALAVFLLALSPLWAQESRLRWVWRTHCDYTYGYCNRVPVRVRVYYRYYRRDYTAERRWHERYDDRDDRGWERRDEKYETGVHCRDERVRVVGTEHLTENGAKNAAGRQWEATVRYDYGEKFADLTNARGMRWRCDKSSTGETVAGRVAEAVAPASGFYKRCVIAARPCLIGTQSGDKDGER